MVLIQAGDTFAGERERHTLEALLSTDISGAGIYLGKTLFVVLYGWTLGVAALVVAVFAMKIKGVESLPAGALVIAALTAVPLVLLAGLAGTLVSARSETVRQAHQTLMSLMLMLIAVPSFLVAAVVALVPRKGDPPGWLIAAVESLRPLWELEAAAWLIGYAIVVMLLNTTVFALGRRLFERDRMSRV